MVNAIPGWNLPVLNFAFHLPRPWTDQFAHVNHWQNNPNFNMLLRLVRTKYFSKANCFRVYWMLITWSTHVKCLLSSFWFYPIANGFTDAPSIKPNHSTWNVTWVLIQILLSCVAFFSAVFRFSSFTCIPIQSLVGVFSFSISVLYQGWIFLQPWSGKTLPTCFVLSARSTRFLYFYFYVFFHGVCKLCKLL